MEITKHATLEKLQEVVVLSNGLRIPRDNLESCYDQRFYSCLC